MDSRVKALIEYVHGMHKVDHKCRTSESQEQLMEWLRKEIAKHRAELGLEQKNSKS